MGDAPQVDDALAAAQAKMLRLVEADASDAEIGAAMFEGATILASLALRMSGAPNLLTASTMYEDEHDPIKRRIVVFARYQVGRSPDDVIAELRRENAQLRGLLNQYDGGTT
jgi:hypothetical protein